MKILWINPSFLDYRVPVYKKLNELTQNNFWIIFSKNRVPNRICNKIHNAIGDNAICFEGEKRIIIGEKEDMSNKWTSIPITHGLYKKIRQIKPDIIIAEGFFQWTPFAVRYTFFHHKPLLIAYERTAHTERNCPKWRSSYRQVIDKFTNGYLCNGILTKEYLEKSLKVNPLKLFIGGMSADSENLIKNISTLTNEEKSRIKRKYTTSNNGLLYLFVGQIIPRKGLRFLLEAWKKHIKIYAEDDLIIVGDGECYQEYIQQYRQISSIHFTGNINYDSIYQFYAIADVFVIPTLEDNWSLVVPEAMACGLPIACSIYNGCYPELVHEKENGSIFDPLNENSILKSLSIFHHVNLQMYRIKSQEIESQFNSTNVAQNIFNACKAVINKTTQK